MRIKFAICLGVAFLLAPLATQAQKSKEEKSKQDFTQPYLLLPARENDLNEAAAFGYRLLIGGPTSSEELPIAIMGKVAQPPHTYQYLHLGVSGSLDEQLIVDLFTFQRQPTAREKLEMKLNEAAQGFRLLPHTVAVFAKQHQIEAVMEKPPGPVLHYQYRVLSNVPRGFVIMIPSEFEKQMRQTAQEGFLPVSLVADNATAILEKPVPAQDEPMPIPAQQSTPDAKPPYCWVSATTTSALQKDLREAATAGYRLGSISTHGDELIALLEKVTQRPDAPEYLLLATTKMSTLQKELNEAGGRGFRLLPRSLITRKPPKGGMVSFYAGLARGVAWDEIVAVMEKAPASPNHFQYQVLQTTRFSTLQKELAQAKEQGYVVVAGNTKGFQYTAILEKPTL